MEFVTSWLWLPWDSYHKNGVCDAMTLANRSHHTGLSLSRRDCNYSWTQSSPETPHHNNEVCGVMTVTTAERGPHMGLLLLQSWRVWHHYCDYHGILTTIMEFVTSWLWTWLTVNITWDSHHSNGVCDVMIMTIADRSHHMGLSLSRHDLWQCLNVVLTSGLLPQRQ